MKTIIELETNDDINEGDAVLKALKYFIDYELYSGNHSENLLKGAISVYNKIINDCIKQIQDLPTGEEMRS